MRTKKASQLFNLVCAAALLFATSCKNQSEENNNSKNKSYVYDTIYKTDGYILLKIKDINNGTKEDKEKIALYGFDSINGPGSEILVQDAKSEIGAFRKKYNTATDSLTYTLNTTSKVIVFPSNVGQSGFVSGTISSLTANSMVVTNTTTDQGITYTNTITFTK